MASISRALTDYTPARLFAVFYVTCGAAVLLGLGALLGLEQRSLAAREVARRGLAESLRVVTGTPQARLFFGYLILLLLAILGQDVLLEPFAADVFGVPVAETSRFVSI
jgi:BCD family chlorophyll transporter-like MFS transporter